jgi:hypothetical protein
VIQIKNNLNSGFSFIKFHVVFLKEIAPACCIPIIGNQSYEKTKENIMWDKFITYIGTKVKLQRMVVCLVEDVSISIFKGAKKKWTILANVL